MLLLCCWSVCLLCFGCWLKLFVITWLSGNGFAVKSDPIKVPPSIEVPELSFEELKEKTDNFGSKALIGEGSYGRVYYAILDSEKHVAVKKLDASTDPELDNEFLTQVWFYSYVHILPVVIFCTVCPSILSFCYWPYTLPSPSV